VLLFALLCASLVAMRVGGTHLHLCLDGSEPPVSLHVADAAEHHADDAGDTPHLDQDVTLGADLLVKKPFSDLDQSTIAPAFALPLFFVTRTRDVKPAFPQLPRLASNPGRLRPPLRGPPSRA
jgi:hypothetical protein